MILYKILLILVCGVTLVISVFLLFKVGQSRMALKLLGLSFVIFMAYFMCHLLWFEFEWILEYSNLLRSFSPIMFLPAPLFYLGIKNLGSDETVFNKTILLHFAPAFLHFFELIPFYSLTYEKKRIIADLVLQHKEGLSFYAHGILPGTWIDFIRLVLMFFYFGYSWRIIVDRYFEWPFSLKQKRSWIFYLVVSLATFHFFVLCQYSMKVQYFFTGNDFGSFWEWSSLIFLITIVVAMYLLVSNLNFTLDVPELGLHKAINRDNFIELNSRNFSKHSLADSNVDVKDKFLLIFNRIQQILEDEKVYKNTDLSISYFSDRLNSNDKYISEAINKYGGMNFNGLINTFRLKEAKNLILDNGELMNLNEVMFACGFDNRSTFYKVFTKQTGMSPKDFRLSTLKNRHSRKI
jgi:AraC-like DNA-binding protein